MTFDYGYELEVSVVRETARVWFQEVHDDQTRMARPRKNRLGRASTFDVAVYYAALKAIRGYPDEM